MVYFSLVPIDALNIPPNPRCFSFFINTLIMPAIPSGSYFAEGFVIISMLCMLLAGICCNASFPSSMLGLPSTRTLKLELPLRVTLPSTSVCIEGVFSSTSTAVPPAELTSSLTVITFLSILYSTRGLSAVTSTASREVYAGSSFIVPKSIILLPGVILIFDTLDFLYPIKLSST